MVESWKVILTFESAKNGAVWLFKRNARLCEYFHMVLFPFFFSILQNEMKFGSFVLFWLCQLLGVKWLTNRLSGFFAIVYLNPLFLSFLLSFFPFSVSLVFFTFHLWCQCTWNLKRRKEYFRLPRTRLNPLTCARKHLRNLWLLKKNFFSWLRKWKLFSVTTNWYNGKLLTNFTREHHAALLERTLIRVPCSSTRNVT